MTNNTDTLNGALQELGETMAENLTTMGVPSTYDEGLTTLAGKILEIAPVPPTPTPASIDLVATNSILSYADGDTTVLTATVLDSNDDPVENVSVELYKAGVLWDTLTTDSSGEVSKTYTSAGIGDITFEAKCNLLTKTYEVIDGIYAHPDEIVLNASASSDKSTPLDSSMSLTLPNKFELSFKLKNENIAGAIRFGIIPVSQKSSNTPTYSLYGQQATGTYVGVYRDSGTHAVGSDTSTTGTSYHSWKIVRDGNTFKWYFDGNQINSNITLTWFDTYTPHLLGWQYWRGGTANVKDIVIKPL